MPDMSNFNTEPGTAEKKVKQLYMDRLNNLQRRIMTYEELPDVQPEKYQLFQVDQRMPQTARCEKRRLKCERESTLKVLK